jgi:hypothetical protein
MCVSYVVCNMVHYSRPWQTGDKLETAQFCYKFPIIFIVITYGFNDRLFFISVTIFVIMSRPDSVQVCVSSSCDVNCDYIEVNWSNLGRIKLAKQQVL